MDYIYEVTEKIDGIETGTKASLIFNEDGCLVSAVFIVGDSEKVASYDRSKIITEYEAKKSALNSIPLLDSINGKIHNIKENLSADFYYADIKTFKGRTYWQIDLPVLLTIDQEQFEYGYTLHVDAFTGEVFEIGFMQAPLIKH